MADLIHKQRIAYLLARKLSNSISEKEKEELQKWLLESQKNIDLASRLQSKTELSKQYLLYRSIDHKRALQLARSEVGLQRNRSRNLYWMKVAASVLVILGLFSIIIYVSNPRNSKLLTHEGYDDISKPGTSKAYVRLENGNLVELNDRAGQVIAEDGYLLQKDTSNQLTYNVKEKSSVNSLTNKIHTIVTPKGADFHLVLSDGSKVWLNAMTELTYPIVFNKERREVKIEGEAYFEVAKDTQRPFIITSPNSQVQVLGTQFNYRSYKEENQDEITLEEGSVKVRGNNRELVIEPGYQAIVSDGQDVIVANQVNSRLYSSWRTGKLEFHRMTLERITSNLSRWYNIDFVFSEEVLKDVQFSGGIYKNESIEYILHLIEETTNVKFSIDGDKIMVSRKK